MPKLSQKTVRDLVLELVNDESSEERVQEIIQDLVSCTLPPSNLNGEEKSFVYKDLVEYLIVSTLGQENKAELILGLLPVFLMICGKDVTGTAISVVDWSLVNKKS